MKTAIVSGFVIAIAAMSQARAADPYGPGAVYRLPPNPPIWEYRPPIPSRRSAAVLASEACWRGCEAQCGGQFQICIRVTAIEDCTARNNACDRFCQRDCRISGGPLLNWTD